MFEFTVLLKYFSTRYFPCFVLSRFVNATRRDTELFYMRFETEQEHHFETEREMKLNLVETKRFGSKSRVVANSSFLRSRDKMASINAPGIAFL